MDGSTFEKFSKQVKEKMKVDIKGVGTISVEEVYSVAPAQAGKKLA
jgi:hypothetical protein